MRLPFSLLICLCFSASIYAQSGNVKPSQPELKPEPTMAETVEWLESSLPNKVSYSGKSGDTEIVSKVTEASIKNCICKVTVSDQFTTAGRYTVRSMTLNQVLLPLSPLDIDEIKAESKDVGKFSPRPIYLNLPIMGGKNLIQKEYSRGSAVTGKSHNVSMESRYALMFDSDDSAERVAKAFRHLVKLCRAAEKKEPF